MKGDIHLKKKRSIEEQRIFIRKVLLLLFLTIWFVLTCVVMYYVYSVVSSEEMSDNWNLPLSWKSSKSVKMSDDEIEQELLRIKRSVLLAPVGEEGQGNSRLYCDSIGSCVHVCHDWFESYKSVDRVCLDKLPAPRSLPDNKDGACSPGVNPRPLIMGNGGGDPKSACENTFEATEAGLKAGMNAVRVDVSMSAEGILFLWRDHLPGSLMARIRQNGLMFVEKCKPMYLPRSFRPAHTLSWGQIRSSWFYTDFANSPQEANVPSLEDWVFNYGLNDQIEKVWLDVHCPDFLVDEILIRAWKLFNSKGIAQKLYYNVEQDATIKFWQALHFVGQVNLRNEVRRLSDRAFEQLSNLIVAPLTSREVQVITNEDFIFFGLLRKLVNNETSVDHLPDPKDSTPNAYLDLVVDGNLVDRVRQLINESSICPNIIVWVVDQVSQIEELKCSTKNVEAIVTNFPGRAKAIVCKKEDKRTGLSLNESGSHTVKPTEPKQVSCDYPCPRILWPVCGSDDRVYPNDCMMEKAACETGKNIVLKTGGDCDPPVFKLLEKQNQAQQKEKESASGSCDTKKFVCSSENFNPNALVCGTNGKIYENRCLFEKEQCVNTALKENTNCVKNTCLLVCGDDSKPVCGTDRITYRNICAMRRMTCLQANVNLFHFGPCGRCDSKCTVPDAENPVCGSDGVTYQNKCALYQSACLRNQPLYIAREGKCKTVNIEVI